MVYHEDRNAGAGISSFLQPTKLELQTLKKERIIASYSARKAIKFYLSHIKPLTLFNAHQSLSSFYYTDLFCL